MLEVELDPSVVDPDDVEMLQDLIIIATNDAIKKAEETTNSTMGQFTKGLNLPGCSRRKNRCIILNQYRNSLIVL